MDPQKTIDVIKELELENLPEEEKDRLVSNMAETLQARISVRVMEVLTPEERAEVDRLVSVGDDQKVGEYVAAKVPGLDGIAKQEAIKLRDELVTSNEQLKEAMAKRKQS